MCSRIAEPIPLSRPEFLSPLRETLTGQVIGGQAAPVTDFQPLTSVEGLPLLGGSGRFRVLQNTERGLLLELEYPAGVASPEHFHDHDSFIYVLSGELTGSVDGREARLGAGDTLVHPRGVRHTVAAVTDSRWLEFKAPPPEVGRVLR